MGRAAGNPGTRNAGQLGDRHQGECIISCEHVWRLVPVNEGGPAAGGLHQQLNSFSKYAGGITDPCRSIKK